MFGKDSKLVPGQSTWTSEDGTVVLQLAGGAYNNGQNFVPAKVQLNGESANLTRSFQDCFNQATRQFNADGITNDPVFLAVQDVRNIGEPNAIESGWSRTSAAALATALANHSEQEAKQNKSIATGYYNTNDDTFVVAHGGLSNLLPGEVMSRNGTKVPAKTASAAAGG